MALFISMGKPRLRPVKKIILQDGDGCGSVYKTHPLVHIEIFTSEGNTVDRATNKQDGELWFSIGLT
jgi:hypothetical protein